MNSSAVKGVTNFFSGTFDLTKLCRVLAQRTVLTALCGFTHIFNWCVVSVLETPQLKILSLLYRVRRKMCQLKKWYIFKKMAQIWQNGSHVEKCHTLTNG